MSATCLSGNVWIICLYASVSVSCESMIGYSEDHDGEVARARYEEKKLDEHRTRADRIVQSPIVLSDEGDEDEDDTGRLSELIALAEAGIQA